MNLEKGESLPAGNHTPRSQATGRAVVFSSPFGTGPDTVAEIPLTLGPVEAYIRTSLENQIWFENNIKGVTSIF